LILSPSSADTLDFCSDSTTLNSTTDTYTDGSRSIVTKNVTCPFGCVGPAGAARCGNNEMLIPIPIYVFMASSGFLFLILSFMRIDTGKYVSLFPWLSTTLFAVLSISSAFIEVDGAHFESVPLLWLWAGMAVLSLLIAIYTTFFKAVEQLEDAGKGLDVRL
jgi:hypothetical protein